MDAARALTEGVIQDIVEYLIEDNLVSVAEAMEKVGKDGVITVEESKSMGTTLEVVEGMQFDRGYQSAYMVTDTEKMEAVLQNPYILLTDKKISSIQENWEKHWQRSRPRMRYRPESLIIPPR